MTNRNKHFALMFDADKCNGCNNCVVSVADEYYENSFPGYSPSLPKDARWFQLSSEERGSGTAVDLTYYLRVCQHCENPPCAAAGPKGAVRIRKDGIVVVDQTLAKGAREIVDACPFGAMVWNEEHQMPQNWNFDAHLLDGGWRAPRPVQACPTGALSFMSLTAAELKLERSSCGPNPFGKNIRGHVLYRATGALENVFVSGRVVRRTADGLLECVKDCEVVLECTRGLVVKEMTDAFGQFRIDGIPRAMLPIQASLIVGSAGLRHSLEIDSTRDIGRIVLNES